MRPYHISIRTLLLIIITILNLLIAAPLGYLAYKSFINYHNAQEIRGITDTLHYLYNTKKYLAQERASALALLYVPSNSYAALEKKIQKSREESKRTYFQSMELIGQSEKPAVRTALEAVQTTYKELQALRIKLDTLVFESVEPAFSDRYFQKITTLNKGIDTLIEAYSRDMIFFDPEITRLMRQTRLIWEISEYASQEYALLGGLIAQNKYPNLDTREQLIALRGRIKYGLELAQSSIANSPWGDEIGPSLEEARTHYLMIFEQIKDVFYQPALGTAAAIYPVSVEMWLQLASEAVNSLHAMTGAALQVNGLYVKGIESRAARSIYISFALLACAMALSIYTWWLITARVVQPVNAMVEALYRETKSTEKDISENDNLDEISKLSQVLEVFRRSLHELEKERDKAQAASIAKSEFLANMSHEIRTPMNVVVGLSTILEKTRPLSDKQKEFIKTLQLSADSLLSLINDLLDFSKIEAQNFHLERTRFNLEKLVTELVRIKDFKARQKGLKFKAEIDDIKGKEYVGDPTRLRQILANLCGNAIKFTEDGVVTLNIRTTPHAGYETLTIEVMDTGIGIPENKLDYIFDKFTQADTSIVRKYGGTGLGLAITKSLVDMMHGEITVESTPGEGTVFTVTLSLYLKTQNNILPPALTRPKKGANKRKSEGKVLLVEDYHPNAIVTGTLLEEFGYEYEVAENGKIAVQKFMEESYPIVLMDVQMPEMDGYEATQAIREYEKELPFPHAKIIGLTAHASTSERDKCLEAGMDDYLAKPFNPNDLEDKL